MRKRILFILLGCAVLPAGLCAGTPAAEEPAPGEWTLATDGDRVTIQTREADLGEVLDGLRAILPPGVRFGEVPRTNITIRFRDIELDRLLQRIGVSYVLTYTQGEDPSGPALSGAWVGVFEPGDAEAARPAAYARGPSSGGPVSAEEPEGIWERAGLRPPEHPDPENGVVLRAPYPVSIAPDGRIEDWPKEVAWQFITPGGAGVAGAGEATLEDTSFAVASAADEERLYFAVHVNDDLRATATPSGDPSDPDDAVRLIIDNPRADEGGTDRPALNMIIKRHHVLHRDPDNPEVLRAAPVQYVRNSAGMTVVIRDGPEGWTLETALDYEALGIEPGEGGELGFNVRLEDVDEGEDEPTRLSWRRSERIPGTAPGSDADAGRLSIAPVH